MAVRRFRVAPGDLDATTLVLSAEETRHLQVMRLGVGASVELFDGAGGVATGKVLDTQAAQARVEVIGPREATAESPVALTLVQAVPVKPQRLDDTVRICTELGVSTMIPVLSTRSQVPAGGPAALARRVVRWRRIAESAAKQCGRAVIPTVHEVTALTAVEWGSVPARRFLLDPEATTSLRAALATGRGASCAICVGPEGGWTADEWSALSASGALPVSLGPRVLRADTAGPVATAMVQSFWGDLA
jgi:16S rRNA (uracil1498-N3)-methyltransferase